MTVGGDDGAGSDGAPSTTSTTGDQSSGVTSDAADDGTTSGGAVDDSSPTSTGTVPSSTGSDASESTGVPFSEDDVLGAWLCTSVADPFLLDIESYTDPQQLSGQVCAPWNKAENPLDWEHCGTLSSHPVGGGVQLWIYAVIVDLAEWTVSAMLVYDPASDSMMGAWQGAGAGSPRGEAIACQRVE